MLDFCILFFIPTNASNEKNNRRMKKKIVAYRGQVPGLSKLAPNIDMSTKTRPCQKEISSSKH